MVQNRNNGLDSNNNNDSIMVRFRFALFSHIFFALLSVWDMMKTCLFRRKLSYIFFIAPIKQLIKKLFFIS